MRARLRYDEDFVEAAVSRCLARRRGFTQVDAGASIGQQPIPSFQAARFHGERERLYAILDPDKRNDGFFELHLQWFREWGLESAMLGILREFPVVTEAVEVLAFRKARSRSDEGAELYVNETGARSGVMALRPDRLDDGPALVEFLRGELTHLHDMLDPAFGYVPVLALGLSAPGTQRVARERYRLLWDITIQGRLFRAHKVTAPARDRLWREFSTAFASWPPHQQQEVFDSLWTVVQPTHGLLVQCVQEARSTSGLGPGAPCPLCDFPAFDWAPSEGLDSVADAIRAEFPEWSRELGACRRCFEAYQVLVSGASVALP